MEMGDRWGRTWLALAVWLAGLFLLPLPSLAAVSHLLAWGTASLPIQAVAAENPLEAQMLGERPFQATPPWPGQSLFDPSLGVALDQEGGATIRLPRNLDLRISFLYDGQPRSSQAERPIHSFLLFKYSMDYRLLPNLQVGLSGFLYHANADFFFYQQRFGKMAMGWGPGIKYDLGRWSFTFKSQLATGERGDGLENWFRVWYAF
jgi:hypothetical protein